MIRAMIAELGHFTLTLALGVALVQSLVPLIGAQRGWHGWTAVAAPAAKIQFLLIAAAFAALTHAFVTRTSRCASSSRTPTR